MKIENCVNLFGLLLIAFGLILVTGCLQDMTSSPGIEIKAGEGINSKEHAMSREHQIVFSKADIPPMDAAAPTVFETASFGLG